MFDSVFGFKKAFDIVFVPILVSLKKSESQEHSYFSSKIILHSILTVTFAT